MKTEFITPLLSIFREDGSIDREGNIVLIRRLIDAGIRKMAVLGSTGEFCYLTLEQKKELISLAKEAVGNEADLLVGAGASCAEESFAVIRYAESLGLEDILLLPPFYFSVSDETIFSFFDRTASKFPARIYMYNYPDRTGNDISSEITLRLLDAHDNIVGYKDTVPALGHTRKLLEAVKGHTEFKVYAGFEDNYIASALSGGAGCVGGLSNIAPEPFLKAQTALETEDMEKTASCQKEINLFCRIYDIVSPFIPAAKRALKIMGVISSDRCAFPLQQITDEQDAALRARLEILGLL